MNYRVLLLGMKDIEGFHKAVQNFNGKVELTNDTGRLRVDGHSLLSCIVAGTEFQNERGLIVETDNGSLYSKIEKWIVLGEDSATIHE